MLCCLQRARKIALGPFHSHFEWRMQLKESDRPLYETITHRRCGGHYLVILAGHDSDPETGGWQRTRRILVPLSADELADVELTPTADLGLHRRHILPRLHAKRWLWLTEGPDRCIGRWAGRLAAAREILAMPPSAWPALDESVPAPDHESAVSQVKAGE